MLLFFSIARSRTFGNVFVGLVTAQLAGRYVGSLLQNFNDFYLMLTSIPLELRK